jgi:hypothetical protein
MEHSVSDHGVASIAAAHDNVAGTIIPVYSEMQQELLGRMPLAWFV